MAWVKLDDQFFFHPKVIAAGRDARDLYLASLTYSAGQLTDGIVPARALPLIGAMAAIDDADAAVGRLLSCRLWEEGDAGYIIHDYHDYNPSAARVKEIRKARAEAGRRGGMGSVPSKSEANEQANEEAKAKPNRTPSPSPSPVVTATGAREEPEPQQHLATPLAELYRLIEHSGTLLNSNTSEVWAGLAEDYGAPLIMGCYREAIEQGKAQPPPAYVKAIAARCKEEGTQPGQRKRPRDAPTRAQPRREAPPNLVSPLDLTAEEIRANNSRQRRESAPT